MDGSAPRIASGAGDVLVELQGAVERHLGGADAVFEIKIKPATAIIIAMRIYAKL
jgi:hypothetical protein